MDLIFSIIHWWKYEKLSDWLFDIWWNFVVFAIGVLKYQCFASSISTTTTEWYTNLFLVELSFCCFVCLFSLVLFLFPTFAHNIKIFTHIQFSSFPLSAPEITETMRFDIPVKAIPCRKEINLVAVTVPVPFYIHIYRNPNVTSQHILSTQQCQFVTNSPIKGNACYTE